MGIKMNKWLLITTDVLDWFNLEENNVQLRN